MTAGEIHTTLEIRVDTKGKDKPLCCLVNNDCSHMTYTVDFRITHWNISPPQHYPDEPLPSTLDDFNYQIVEITTGPDQDELVKAESDESNKVEAEFDRQANTVGSKVNGQIEDIIRGYERRIREGW